MRLAATFLLAAHLLAQDYRIVSVNHDGTAISFETSYRQIGSMQTERPKLFWFDATGIRLLADDGASNRASSADGSVTLAHLSGSAVIDTPSRRFEFPGSVRLSRNGDTLCS